MLFPSYLPLVTVVTDSVELCFCSYIRIVECFWVGTLVMLQFSLEGVTVNICGILQGQRQCRNSWKEKSLT